MAVGTDLVTSTIASSGVCLRELSHTFPNGTQALANVNFDIPRGLFGLLGPNGAGKTTLMRVLATLLVPNSGRVHFNGLDVLARPLEMRRQLGYLPQEFGVYPGISAEKILDHIAVLKGIGPAATRREQVHNLLKITNLYDVRTKAVSGYSGGMRRRFGIAQALLGDPKLVIVDEPTAGLDPAERERFLNLLSEIGEDTVVILSTHILDEVEKICPHIGVLLKGRVVGVGTYDDLLQQLAGRVWRKAVPRAEVAEIRQSLHVLTERHARGQVVVHVHSPSCPDGGFEPVSGDLHDVYFAMTAEVGSA
ncbi:MAG TPA: ABC transporter ATP-binding protein [Burkholderiales bacterium]|nr:ABC transporter ATP-binding protein [Burkholderiales bacterium]